MKIKVPELETKLNALEKAKIQDGEERVLNPLKRKKCEREKTFSKKKLLKKHIKEVHPQEVQCGMCNESFKRNCDLEVHIEAKHKAPKKFKCNKCDMKFFLNLRLKKHKDLHTSQITRNCHYLKI